MTNFHDDEFDVDDGQQQQGNDDYGNINDNINDNDNDHDLPPFKKQKRRTVQGNDGGIMSTTMMTAVVPSQNNDAGAAVGSSLALVLSSSSSLLRTSSLPSPTLQLTGHTGSVYGLSYSPSGQILCSTSFDKTCLLWNHHDGSYNNINVLHGHKNAVLDCAWCDDMTIVTCGADKTVQLWNSETGQRLRKWHEHSAVVNACCTVPLRGHDDDHHHHLSSINTTDLIASVGDDGCCILWDRRQKPSATVLESDYPVLAVAMTEQHIYTAGIDPNIIAWDYRMTHRKIYAMRGHDDAVTGLAMHPDSTHLLSNSQDSTLRSWDIRPYVVATTTNTSQSNAGGTISGGVNSNTNRHRHVNTFRGHAHGAERGLLKCSWSSSSSWSPSGVTTTTNMMVSAGSADKLVHIWDNYSQEELYVLPGHKGCVNHVIFHPFENIIASAGSDKLIYVGELS